MVGTRFSTNSACLLATDMTCETATEGRYMQDETQLATVYLVYEPHRGSETGHHVIADSFDDAAQLYCDIEECTQAFVTVRVVNQTTNEWEDVKMQAMSIQPDEASRYGAN